MIASLVKKSCNLDFVTVVLILHELSAAGAKGRCSVGLSYQRLKTDREIREICLTAILFR